MDAKEVIISTISEISSDIKNEKEILNIESKPINDSADSIDNIHNNVDSTMDFMDILVALRDRALVLFEGLKQNKEGNIEVKLNMVLSYLEYQLCLIEDKINKSKN